MSEIAKNVSEQGPVRKGKRKRRILIIFAVSLLNIGILTLIWTQLLTPATSSQSSTFIGHAAPNFSLSMLRPSNQQNTLALSDFKGKSIVLNFWASWCEPCQEEAPLMESTWKQVQEKNIVFLGIDYQESTPNAINFLQLYNITYPTVLDAHGLVANKYSVTSLPVTVFINQQGIVISKESQQLNAQLLASNLRLIM
jgi:cytochrome c biogenesis protein CcmG/thiol:disulfide interchange protein DsbE